MFNINKISAIALTTRVRGFLNANEVDGVFIDDYVSDKSAILSESNLNITTHAWAEFGITYARVITNKEDYFLKAGVTFKFLKGFGAGYLMGNDLNINYDNAGTILPEGQTTGSITSSGELIYGRYGDNRNGETISLIESLKITGLEWRVIYEWRPDYRKFDYKNIKGKSYTRRDKTSIN